MSEGVSGAKGSAGFHNEHSQIKLIRHPLHGPPRQRIALLSGGARIHLMVSCSLEIILI